MSIEEKKPYIIKKFDKSGDYKGYDIDYEKLSEWLKENDYGFKNGFVYHYENGVYKQLNSDDYCHLILPDRGLGRDIRQRQQLIEKSIDPLLILEPIDETGIIYYKDKMCSTSDYEFCNFKNGLSIMSLQTGKINNLPHDNRNVCFQQVNAELKNVEADHYTEMILNRVEQNGKGSVDLLFEIIGAIMWRSRDKSIFNIVGCKDSGKSVIKAIIIRLLSSEYVSTINNAQLTENSKELRKIINAYVNIADDDLINFNDNGAFLKRLSSGGSKNIIPIYIKYQEPIETVIRTKFLFTSNDPISLHFTTNDTKALLDRLVILVMNVATPKEEQVMDIADKVDLNYWAFRATIAYSKLVKRNYQYTKVEGAEDFIETDDFSEWFMHHVGITDNKDDWIKIKDLYSNYKEYCNNNLYIPMNERCFGKKLSNTLKQKSTVKKINGSSYRIYNGIKLKGVGYKDIYNFFED